MKNILDNQEYIFICIVGLRNYSIQILNFENMIFANGKIKFSTKHRISPSGHELASKEFPLSSDGNPAEKMTIISLGRGKNRKIRSSSSFDIFASENDAPFWAAKVGEC